MEPKRKKTGGRKKGVPNRTTKDMRELINEFLSKNWNQVQKKFNSLDAKDQLLFLEKLLKFSIPVMSTVSAKVDYEKLSDSDLDTIINKLIEQAK